MDGQIIAGEATIVLNQIKYMTSYVFAETLDFADEWMQGQEKEPHHTEKRLAQAWKRSEEIDDLLRRTYEDYAKGLLKLERYQKMSAKYEQEQSELGEEIETLDKKVRRNVEASDSFDWFMDLIRKYVGERIEELTPTMANEFVKKIIVHEADHSDHAKRVLYSHLPKREFLPKFHEYLLFSHSSMVYPGANCKLAIPNCRTPRLEKLDHFSQSCYNAPIGDEGEQRPSAARSSREGQAAGWKPPGMRGGHSLRSRRAEFQ